MRHHRHASDGNTATAKPLCTRRPDIGTKQRLRPSIEQRRPGGWVARVIGALLLLLGLAVAVWPTDAPPQAQVLQQLADDCDDERCRDQRARATELLADHLTTAELRALFDAAPARVAAAAIVACGYADARADDSATRCLDDATLQALFTHPHAQVRADALQYAAYRWDPARMRPVLLAALNDAALVDARRGISVADVALDLLHAGAFAIAAPPPGYVLRADAEATALRRSQRHDHALNFTLRASFFAAVRRIDAQGLDARFGALYLSSPLTGQQRPEALDAASQRALAAILHSTDDLALQALLAHRQPLVRLAALDALSTRTDAATLVAAALDSIARDPYVDWIVPAMCVAGFVRLNDVVAQTLLPVLDATALAELYARGDESLRRALINAAQHDHYALDAMAAGLRRSIAEGDTIALRNLPLLRGGDADAELALRFLPTDPELALRALHGNSSPRALQGLRDWSHTALRQPCADAAACADVTALYSGEVPWAAFYETALSLGEAGVPLLRQLLRQIQPVARRIAHERLLWGEFGYERQVWGFQRFGLVGYGLLLSVGNTTREPARQRARWILAHVRTVEAQFLPTITTAPAEASAAASRECRSEAADLLYEASDLLRRAHDPQLPPLLRTSLTQVSPCNLAHVAEQAVINRLEQTPSVLLQRLPLLRDDYAIVAVAFTIGRYRDPAQRQRFEQVWQTHPARTPALESRVQQALQRGDKRGTHYAD